MKIKINHYLLLFLWKFILDISYVYFVVPLFGYSGFDLEISYFRITESYLLVVLMGMLSPKNIDRVARFLIYILFLSVVVPVMSYFSLSKVEAWPAYLMALQYLIVLFVYKFWTASFINLKPVKGGTKIASNISLFFVAFMLVYTLFIQNGIQRLNFDLSKIYEVRETSNELFGSGIFGYLLPWTFRVFNILLIVLSIQSKKYFRTILFSLVQVLFFGLTGFKAVLIYPLVLAGAYYVLKSKHKLTLLYIALICSVSVPLAIYWYSQDITLSSIFIRRTYFIPSMINFQYYDYFSKNEFVMLSNSILSWLFVYPYHVTPAVLIGGVYGFGDATNANTGFLATSYMHFGLLGVVLYPTIVGAILKLIDKYEKKTSQWILLGLLILPFNGLFRSADLTTAILTHGLALALLMLWLINRNDKISK